MERRGARCELIGERGGGQPRRGGEHDQIFVIVGRHSLGDLTPGVVDAAAHRFRLIKDAAVAAVAVEEIEFGEHPLGPAARLEQRQAALDRGRLPHRPHLDMVGARIGGAELAPAIVGVFLMMRLQRREEVQLERDARMPCRHDAVGDELPVAGRSEMAIDAHPGADHRILELFQPRRQVGEMFLAHFGIGIGAAPDPGIMAGEPAARRTMA